MLAEKYGAKYIILMSAMSSALINMLTPVMAGYSFSLLVVSRILLGAMQAGIVPAMYALFSKWLTMTETSIFAPMIKVALAIGVLLGSLLPGVIISSGLGWPIVFYVSGFVCLIWALPWLAVSSSTPQQSKFVGQLELDRIMRKKQPAAAAPAAATATGTGKPASVIVMANCNSADVNGTDESVGGHSKTAASQDSVPWLLIMRSPSVLALIFVKLTYNFPLDFAFIELSSYLKNVHHAPMSLVSIVTGS